LIDDAPASALLVPAGFTDSLTPVAQFIEWLQPELVSDVGAGRGRMGSLAREYGRSRGIHERVATAVIVHDIAESGAPPETHPRRGAAANRR
jgi:hypothetical protein